MTKAQIIEEMNFIKEVVNNNTANGIFTDPKVWDRYAELAEQMKNM